MHRARLVLIPLAVFVLVLSTAGASAAASPATPRLIGGGGSKCGGVFVGKVVALRGIQRLATCKLSYDGNPIKVQATDLGVSVPPPVVFVAVVALPGFPPKPTVVAKCASVIDCQGRGTYSPTGPLGQRLYCVFGAVSVRVTVEVAYRFSCSSGRTGVLPL